MKYHVSITAVALLVLTSFTSYGQEERRNYFPVWSFRHEGVNIHGISVGFFSKSDQFQTNTNGIKLELIGLGLIAGAFIPASPIAENDSVFDALMKYPITERINGLDLSVSGAWCDSKTNGIKVGGVSHCGKIVNGISVAAEFNFVQVHNGLQIGGILSEAYFMKGIQISIFSNHAHKTRGLQVALFNNGENLKGIQIGLWNRNSKRNLPIINWSF